MRIHYNLLLLFLLFPLFIQAKEVPTRSNTIVTDYVGVLSQQERTTLERKLVAFDDTSSTQIAIVIENSLEGDEIFDYSYRLAEAWGIGQGGKDNGVLIYLAYQDREIYIQTGYGAEGFLTDAMVKRIIDQVIVPAFRNNNYYRGLSEASDIIMQLAAGEYTAENERKESGFEAVIIIFLLLVAVIVFFSFFGGGDDWDDDGGYNRRGRYDYDDYDDYRRGCRRGRRGGWIIFPGGGGGGGWDGGGGGFGGGGFGGFGGGGFGGGGAGGSW